MVSPEGGKSQWSFLVPLIGGRGYIITQLAIYKWYISGIYCQLGLRTVAQHGVEKRGA